MLQTMICGGAEHVTAILKLNRVGLRSRALLTSCPFRLTNPRAASALLLHTRMDHARSGLELSA